VGDDDMRQKNGPFREDSLASQSSLAGPGSLIDNRNPHGVIGTDPSNGKGKETADNGPSGSQDPLAGLSAKDRWGLKGLRHLMDAHPDYNTLLVGVEPTALGVDLTSNEYVPSRYLLG
jgi:CCR4-NOT transcription complex subunit 2